MTEFRLWLISCAAGLGLSIWLEVLGGATLEQCFGSFPGLIGSLLALAGMSMFWGVPVFLLLKRIYRGKIPPPLPRQMIPPPLPKEKK
jgi:hypothetical protein